MRALWSLVVVCLVAAGGVGRADARLPRTAAMAQRVSPLERAQAIRVASHVGARLRASARHLPPAVLAARPSVGLPSTRVLAPGSVASEQVPGRLLLTGSARGPPI
ncbi:MAG TPA: hypothetical protein VFT22_18410 [Kofleriaceae bacterium]|nr:hypothetical protein [Kofleriaceae bacterium]